MNFKVHFKSDFGSFESETNFKWNNSFHKFSYNIDGATAENVHEFLITCIDTSAYNLSFFH